MPADNVCWLSDRNGYTVKADNIINTIWSVLNQRKPPCIIEMSMNKYSFNHSTRICWIQMTNKYSDNAPEMCWHEATERGVGFLSHRSVPDGAQTRRPIYYGLWEVLGCQTEKPGRKGQKVLPWTAKKLKGFSSLRWACWLCPSGSLETPRSQSELWGRWCQYLQSSGQTHPRCLTGCLESCVYLADNCRFDWNATRFIKYFRDTVSGG